MKSLMLSITVMAAAAALLEHATTTSAQSLDVSAYQTTGAIAPSGAAATSAWPVVFSRGSTTYTIFEPQCDAWNGHDLVARSAVGVQSAGQAKPNYGVVRFNAITLVDKTTRTAKLADLKITRADFPSARADGPAYTAALNQQFPQQAAVLPLDRLETSLNLPASATAPQTLDNTPPKVLIATRPAVLVCIDGPPAWRPVAGTDLQRVINTRMLLLKDSSDQYYLHLFDGYLQASSLEGPWKVASQPPAGAATAEKVATDSGEVDLMRGTPDATTLKTPSLSTAVLPDVFVENRPSELITFNGPPEYASIAGTDLLYVENTSGNVFKSLNDQQNYILISGRWYRSASLNGPWQFVPGNQLPSDFANIPDSSPKENVKASVPGTPQAEEALIANSIPQSTAVARTTPMASPQVDGAPQLAAIDGTPLHYIVNSATPIIEVDPAAWYACQNGVWYVSTSASGPWSVATQVPQVIYTIPTTSPLHYLTYVQVYGSTPDQVYEGYTPGYFGTEVAPDNTVVYGTGYDYEPWIGDVWYGPPITWGCGFAPCWAPWCGWGFGCGFGWGCGWGVFGWGCDFFPPFPWGCGFGCFGDFDRDDFHHGFDHGFDRGGFDHGGFDHRGFGRGGFGGNGFANTSGNLYHHGGFGGVATRGQFAGTRLNGFAGRGMSGEFGHAYNSRTGQLAAGQRGQVHSVTGGAWDRGRTGFAGNNAFAARNNSFANRGAFGGGRTFAAGSGSINSARSWSVPSQRNFEFHTGSFPSVQNFGRVQPNFGGVNRSFQGQFGGWRGGNSFNTFRSAPSFGGFSGGQFGGGFRSGGLGGYSGGFRGGNFGGGSAFRGGGFGGGFRGGGSFGGGFHGGGGGRR